MSRNLERRFAELQLEFPYEIHGYMNYNFLYNEINVMNQSSGRYEQIISQIKMLYTNDILTLGDCILKSSLRFTDDETEVSIRLRHINQDQPIGKIVCFRVNNDNSLHIGFIITDSLLLIPLNNFKFFHKCQDVDQWDTWEVLSNVEINQARRREEAEEREELNILSQENINEARRQELEEASRREREELNILSQENINEARRQEVEAKRIANQARRTINISTNIETGLARMPLYETPREEGSNNNFEILSINVTRQIPQQEPVKRKKFLGIFGGRSKNNQNKKKNKNNQKNKKNNKK